MNTRPRTYLITLLIGNFSPPLKQGGISKHIPGLQKGAFESALKSVLHGSILILVTTLKFLPNSVFLEEMCGFVIVHVLLRCLGEERASRNQGQVGEKGGI